MVGIWFDEGCFAISDNKSSIPLSIAAPGVTRITQEASDKMSEVRALIAKLAAQVPNDQYYRLVRQTSCSVDVF
jgi:hypothetical protein